MLLRKFAENPVSGTSQRDDHLPPVEQASPAFDETLRLKSIDQFAGAMVPELKAFREVSDCGAFTGIASKSFCCEEELMMLRFDLAEARGLFAEMQKAADVVAEFGQCLEIIHG